ncbi:hypothetical protein JHK82_012235 [Glycine max]|nr:hypothetical protein JHK86_012237 [Glycine max]KAG5154266.1 hypothetical protein JHK82_012235 [Glycine max]
MQNAITTQFSNLGVTLLQNLQQAQMPMLGYVATPTPIVTTHALALIQQPPFVERTPHLPPSSTLPIPPPEVQSGWAASHEKGVGEFSKVYGVKRRK